MNRLDFTSLLSKAAIFANLAAALPAYASAETPPSICQDDALVPEVAVPGAYNQVCMNLPTRTIPLKLPSGKSESVTIEEGASGSGKTGLAVWNSALLLTRVLQQVAPNLLQELSSNSETTTILELGCGTGLVSIVADKLLNSNAAPSATGKATILATDGNPDVVDLAQRNIQRNQCSAETTKAVELQWGLLNAMDYCEVADVVLGSDLTYNSGTWRVLSETMTTILKPNGVVIYLSLGHEGFNVNSWFPAYGSQP